MEITRSSLDAAAGPSDWFTGNVYFDAVAAPKGSGGVNGAAGRSSWGEPVSDEEYAG